MKKLNCYDYVKLRIYGIIIEMMQIIIEPC